MSSYTTIVVGTDGSDTSMRAVERAGALAADAGATLVLVCAYLPDGDHKREQDQLGGEGYQIVGSAPAEGILQRAEDHAVKTGARDIEKIALRDAPVKALRKAVKDSSADLLVVGNVGLNSLSGRLFGSVPSDVARGVDIDVLIVHTS